MKVGKVSLLDIIGCGFSFFFRNILSLFILLFTCLGIPVGLLLVFANYLGRMDLFYNITSGKEVTAVKALFAENMVLGTVSTIFFGLLGIVLFSGFIKSILSLNKNKRFYVADLFSVYKKLLNIIGLFALREFIFMTFAQVVTVPFMFLISFLAGQGLLLKASTELYIATYFLVALGVIVTNFVEICFYMALFSIIDQGKGLFQSSDFSFRLIRGNTIRLIILFALTTFLSRSYKLVELGDVPFTWEIVTFIFIILIAVLKICFYMCTYHKLLAIKKEN